MTAPMNLREYFAAVGSPYTKADAEVIGPQIEALAEEGDVSPERIRDVARSPGLYFKVPIIENVLYLDRRIRSEGLDLELQRFVEQGGRDPFEPVE